MLKQRKPIDWRLATVFASGIFLGGIAVAWAVMSRQASAVSAPPTTATAPAAPAVKIAAPAATSPQSLAQTHSACPAAQLIAASGRDDGQMRVRDTATKTPGEISALILSGKEAAAASRPRDAELAFITACWAADQLRRADATEPADARYQLARHYAHHLQVVKIPAGARRDELARRAELLYSDSLQFYRARFGESHEKTRFAAEGVATLRQSFAQAAPAPAPAPARARRTPLPPVAQTTAPAPARTAVAAAVPARPAIVAAAPPPERPRFEVVTGPVRQATGVPTQVRPSFDCDLARSPSERRICSDTELAQLDRDLGRLHARARMSAPDSAAFRRQNEREWKRRESICRGDRDCLIDWYAHRRDQLLEDLDQSR